MNTDEALKYFEDCAEEMKAVYKQELDNKVDPVQTDNWYGGTLNVDTPSEYSITSGKMNIDFDTHKAFSKSVILGDLYSNAIGDIKKGKEVDVPYTGNFHDDILDMMADDTPVFTTLDWGEEEPKHTMPEKAMKHMNTTMMDGIGSLDMKWMEDDEG